MTLVRPRMRRFSPGAALEHQPALGPFQPALGPFQAAQAKAEGGGSCRR